MSVKDIYEKFQCSSSNNDHIVQEPISLNCGHCICKKCLLKSKNQDKFICNICNQVTEGKFIGDKESTLVKSMITHFLSQFFIELEKKTNEGVDKLKGTMKAIKFVF